MLRLLDSPPSRRSGAAGQLRTRIPAAVTRAACALAAHDLVAPLRSIGASREPMYRTYCVRCLVRGTGDWVAMERLGAWQHYRSSF